jgi:hypothetical protein
MAALAGRELSNCTFAAEPEASRGQNGQTMLQVTNLKRPNNALQLRLGAGTLAVRVPQDRGPYQTRRITCTQ